MVEKLGKHTSGLMISYKIVFNVLLYFFHSVIKGTYELYNNPER
jgi:hypothetical protein